MLRNEQFIIYKWFNLNSVELNIGRKREKCQVSSWINKYEQYLNGNFNENFMIIYFFNHNLFYTSHILQLFVWKQHYYSFMMGSHIA